MILARFVLLPLLSRRLAPHRAALRRTATTPLITSSVSPLRRSLASCSPYCQMSFTGKYPAVRRDESVVETLHGHAIADPYRWLEDPDAPETAAFVDAQNELTHAYLGQSTVKDAFKHKMTVMYDYEKYSCPFKRGDWFFYFYNSGLQPQSVLYKQFKSLDAPGEELLNPNTLTTDGTKSLTTYGFTEDGSLIAYALSQSGSDWTTILVKDVATGENLADELDWVKFSGIAWTHDNKGFFYSKYPKPASVSLDKAGTETDKTENQKLYYHKIGTKQEDDILVYADAEHPQWIFGGEVSDDGEYLLMTSSESTDPVNRLYIAKLDKAVGVTTASVPSFVKVVDTFEAEYSYITNDGPLFYFKTNKHAPKYKVVSLDFSDTTKAAVFVDLLPESEDPLQSANVVAEDKLVVTYLHDVKDVLLIHDLKTGKLVQDLKIDIGTVSSITGRKKDTHFFYQHVSFLSPGIIHHVEAATGASTVFRETKVKDFDRSEFKAEQVFYTSKDGVTKIPMFLLSRKDAEKNGQNPTLLYAYGGFNISITPSFSVSRLLFAKHFGGVIAVANIRGGGEYGEDWHKNGTLFQKQNGFDDFAAAAEYLVAEKYTSHAKICINGGSNGGLLVGASITQNPQLFGAAIADVGVLDMLRFHKFSIGFFWKADYGDPDVAADFEYLLKYSPLHNVDAAKAPYPAVLLTTGDHDDRVVPLHSFKMIAQLQHALGAVPQQTAPLLIRVEKKAGHGAGRPTQKIIDETTDRFTFLALAVGATWTD